MLRCLQLKFDFQHPKLQANYVLVQIQDADCNRALIK